MKQLLQHIDNQFKFNSGKNLLANKAGLFQFIELPVPIKQELKSITKEEENQIINYITNRSLEAFYQLNQFYYFSRVDEKMLHSIYTNLIQHIKNDNDLTAYEKAHYDKLKNWLSTTNPFASQLYSEKTEKLRSVVCEEYDVRLQFEVLHIDLNNIKEPVLDIGCGKNGAMVNYLRKMGIEAFGFDRINTGTAFCLNTDWFDFNFEKEKYGTIISHLSFTNHFNHHHHRTDGNYKLYAQTFMQILDSLKPDSTFHYAPGLPFIEKYLDNTKYDLKIFEICNTSYKTTILRKKLFKN